MTSEGIEIPAELTAGPVLVIGHNETGSLIGIDFVKLPEGVSVEDLLGVTAAGDGRSRSG